MFEAGPTSLIVRTNIRRLREARGLSTYKLADLLAPNGWPLPQSAVAKIERGERRVDVDDLAALAVVLGTSPAALLGAVGCTVCLDAPPEGFTCNACSTTGQTPHPDHLRTHP